MDDRDDRDPTWINKNIKRLTLDKNNVYKSLQFLNQFQFLQTKFNSLIKEPKKQFYTCSSH